MPQALARQALLRLAQTHQLPGVRDRLLPMADTLAADLIAVETGLRNAAEPDGDLASKAASHLLAAGGKRVRPVLCLLVAKAFPPGEPPPTITLLAQVAELVHNATLLHDDVIDLGDVRRDRPTSRAIYGNAASVLGGDLLLVQALGLIEAAGVPMLVPSMLDVLRRMIAAESLQLENRGRADVTETDYFTVSEGKTASLFEWAVEAGARCVGAEEHEVRTLLSFGHEVGVAFQLLDDLLDLQQAPDSIGKNVLQDVQGGTVTYPVILALKGRPALAARLAEAAGGVEDEALAADILAAVRESGALDDCRRLIAERTTRALAALAPLKPSDAKGALAAVATALTERAR